ncbi:UNVERIFIED_CONTAM: hypothetical protein K2H54_016143 [Gekko kuhli]
MRFQQRDDQMLAAGMLQLQGRGVTPLSARSHARHGLYRIIDLGERKRAPWCFRFEDEQRWQTEAKPSARASGLLPAE